MLVITAVVLCTLPVRLRMLGTIPEFFVAYATLLVASDFATMLLLGWRAHSSGDRRVGFLAGGYAFTIPLVLANVFTLPGVAAYGGFPFEAPPQMWAIWHLGLTITFALYAWRVPRTGLGVRGRVVIGGAIGLGCVGVALFAPRLLPPVLGGGGEFLPMLYAVVAVVLAIDAFAVIGLLRRRSALTTLDLWVICAAFTLGAETLLNAISPVRFDIGTYVARVLSVISSLTVFASLAVDALRADRHASLLARQASLAEASPQIVMLAEDGLVTFVNHRFVETTGITADEALGDGWFRAQRADATEEERAFVAAIRSGAPFDGVVRFVTSEGPRSFLVRTSRMPDGDDVRTVWLVTAVDVDDQRRALEDLREMYARERRISAALQQVSVPAMLPTIEGVRFDAVYRPATREGEVGGDWYDAFALPDGRVAVSIGDSTGHGIEAASAMVRVRETMRAATTSLGAEPDEVLAFVNRAMCAADDGLLASAIFGIYDPPTRLLRYAVAGHPAPLVRDARGVTALPGGGITLGVSASATFASIDVTLAHDGSVAFYTDGLIENERDLESGERRLAALFAQADASAAAIVDAVTAAGQNDDVAVLVFSATPLTRTAPVWRFHSDDPETARTARRSFAEYLTRYGCSADAVAVAELVFGELVGNVVRHAPGPIDIDLVRDGDMLVLRVHDRGKPMRQRPIGLPSDIMSENGRGLFLVRTLAGEPTFERRGGGGNIVTVPLTGLMPALAS